MKTLRGRGEQTIRGREDNDLKGHLPLAQCVPERAGSFPVV